MAEHVMAEDVKPEHVHKPGKSGPGDGADYHLITGDLDLLDAEGKILPSRRQEPQRPMELSALPACPYIGDASDWFPEAPKQEAKHE